MQITDIRIRRTYQDTRLKALVSVTVGGDLAVHDIKIIEGPERLFVAMPSRKEPSGIFRDIAHPISPAARRRFEEAILTEYRAAYRREKAAESYGYEEYLPPAASASSLTQHII